MDLSHRERYFWLVIAYLYFSAWYQLSIHLSVQQQNLHFLLLPGESNIPFIPHTFWIYMSLFVSPIFIFLFIKRRRALFNLILTFFIAIWISKWIWLSYPVQYSLRPTVDVHSGLLAWLILLFYKTDAYAVNCFPSLHVTFAFLFFFAILENAPRYAWIFFIHAVLVMLSTLTFKQHYIADAIAGIILSTILWKTILQSKVTLTK